MAMAWAKWYWTDYAADPALKVCSFAAQGLWMRMLCIAAEHEPIGYVSINGKPLDGAQVARLTGGAVDEVCQLISELDDAGVFSRDRSGTIYSRRMVSDAKRAKTAQKNGAKGGNPKLRKQTGIPASDNQPPNPEDKGGDKTQKPEARVQKEKEPSVPKKALPKGWAPEPFGEGTKCRGIVDAWPDGVLALQVERFAAHHTARGNKFTDWQAAWKTWVLNSEGFSQPAPARPASGDGGRGDFLEFKLAQRAQTAGASR